MGFDVSEFWGNSMLAWIEGGHSEVSVQVLELSADGISEMPILEWKRKKIAMEFMVGLPKAFEKYDSICTIGIISYHCASSHTKILITSV